MSTPQDRAMELLARVETTIDTFEQMVIAAEVNLEKGAGTRKVSGILSSLSAGIESISGDEAESVLSILSPDLRGGFAESWQSFLMARDMVNQYIGKVPGMDRIESDAMARKAQALLDGAWVEDEETITRVEELLARYASTTPASSARARSTRSASSDGEVTRKATLGFTMEMVCTEHAWTGRDSTDVNSARSCVLKHMDKAHGGKVAKDNPIWQQITGALKAVAEGASESAGAFVKVKRAA